MEQLCICFFFHHVGFIDLEFRSTKFSVIEEGGGEEVVAVISDSDFIADPPPIIHEPKAHKVVEPARVSFDEILRY